ncbi:MAG: PQQ-binding-like beta-propeller repeat protein [Planctomycetaceae bacterium]
MLWSGPSPNSHAERIDAAPWLLEHIRDGLIPQVTTTRQGQNMRQLGYTGWRCAVLAAAALLSLTGLVHAQENWTRFRGENGVGHATQAGIPNEWTAADYEWVRELPGKGHSSPVIWGEHLFVTCGTDDGKRLLVALDPTSGGELWTHTMTLGASHLHLKNSYASGTPATDGERVYVAFADEAHYVVKAFSFAGDELWSRDLGTFNSQHGPGVSPMVLGEYVIVANDQLGSGAILALDRKTGETMWTTQDRPFRRASYATPMLLNTAGREELVCLCGAAGLTAHDPADGKLLWTSGELPARTVASPVAGNGVVIGICGQGGGGVKLVAVKPGQDGQPASVAWELEKSIPYVPTPVVDGEYLYLWLDSGIVHCLNMATGETVWIERVGGKFSGSPVLVDGRLFCISEDGEVVVLAAGPEFQLLGRSPLDDESYSTPAVARGRMYLRGFNKLACLKAAATSN